MSARRAIRRACVVLCLLVPTLFAAPARADGAQDAAAAEKLFRDGRALLTAGKAREACEKFGESKRLDPAPGTMLNLGQCYEGIGRTASAWATYRELESRATKLGQTARADFARRKAADLEPLLPSLVIRVPVAHKPEGLVVELDGTALGVAAWDVRVPVDPGPHRIAARATERKPWSLEIDARPATSADVTVPLLEPAPEAKASTASASRPTRPLATAGIITAIAGGAVLGAGLVIGGVAKLKNDQAHRDECDARGCSSEGLRRIGRADDLATVSTITTITGAVVVAAGVALWVFAPKSAGKTRGAAAAVLAALGPTGAVF